MFRKLISSILVAVYLAVASGVALPIAAPSTVKATASNSAAPSTERSPCDDRQCGCQGGLYCWTHCYCESLEMKLRWAKRTGTRPPAIALARAKTQGLDVSLWDPTASPTKPTTSASHKIASTPTQCDGCCCHSKPQSKSTSPETKQVDDRRVVLIQAMQCRGLSYQWLAISVAVPPLAPVVCPELKRQEDTPVAISQSYDSILLSIETPPPRAA